MGIVHNSNMFKVMLKFHISLGMHEIPDIFFYFIFFWGGGGNLSGQVFLGIL